MATMFHSSREHHLCRILETSWNYKPIGAGQHQSKITAQWWPWWWNHFSIAIMTDQLTTKKEYGFAGEVKPKKKLRTGWKFRIQLVQPLHLTPHESNIKTVNTAWKSWAGFRISYVFCHITFHPSHPYLLLHVSPLPHTLLLLIERSRSKISNING